MLVRSSAGWWSLCESDAAMTAAQQERAAPSTWSDDARRNVLEALDREALEGPAPAFASAGAALDWVARARRARPASWEPGQYRPDAPQQAAQPRRDGVTVLLSGVDALSLAVDVPIRADVLEALAELRELAERTGERQLVARGPWRWELLPHGMRPHWAFALVGPAFTIKLRRAWVDVSTRPGCYMAQIDFRAVLLARDGADQAVDDALGVLASWSDTPAALPPAVVTRIDLYADWQGWQPQAADLDAGAWVTRAVHRARYTAAEALPVERIEEPDDHAADASYWRGRTFTGFVFGKGAAVARIYEKNAELKKSGKYWLHALWGTRYDDSAPVWRLEFQLRTELLKEIVATLQDAQDGRPHDGRQSRPHAVIAGHSWDAVRLSLGALWRAMTGAPELTAEDSTGWARRLRDGAAAETATRRAWVAAWAEWAVESRDRGREPRALDYGADARWARGRQREALAQPDAPRQTRRAGWLTLRAVPGSAHWPADRAEDQTPARWPVRFEWQALARAAWPGRAAARRMRIGRLEATPIAYTLDPTRPAGASIADPRGSLPSLADAQGPNLDLIAAALRAPALFVDAVAVHAHYDAAGILTAHAAAERGTAAAWGHVRALVAARAAADGYAPEAGIDATIETLRAVVVEAVEAGRLDSTLDAHAARYVGARAYAMRRRALWGVHSPKDQPD